MTSKCTRNFYRNYRAGRHESVTVMMCNDWGELSSPHTSNTTVTPDRMKTVLRLYVFGCRYEIQFVAKTRCLTVFRNLSLQHINVMLRTRALQFQYTSHYMSILLLFVLIYIKSTFSQCMCVFECMCVYLRASMFCKYISTNVTPVFAKVDIIKPYLFTPK